MRQSTNLAITMATAAALLAAGCGGGGGSGLTCAAGTHEVDGECVADVTCAAGTHAVDGECVPDVTCAAGTHEEGGECVPDVTCGAGTHDEGGECVPDADPDTTAPAVTVTPPAGTYREVPVVTMTADEPAMIYYTVDGTDPTTASTGDGSPALILDVVATTTVRYMAVDGSGNASAIGEAVYTIDATAPAPAIDLVAVATRSGAPSIDLSWTDPTGAGYATSVLVRGEGAPVTVALEDGTAYSPTDGIGSFEVLYVGAAGAYVDGDVVGGTTYHYAVFAADDLLNYAAPATASAMPRYMEGTLVIPSAEVGVEAVLEAGAGGLQIVAASDVNYDTGVQTIWVGFRNDSDGILFNPKLVITSIDGATIDDEDGTLDGDPFFYYGPTGVAQGEWSPLVGWQVTTSTWPVTIEFVLVTNPMAYLSHADCTILSAVDTGTHQLVDSPDFGYEMVDGVYFNAVTPDGRYFLGSSNYEKGILVLDTTTHAVAHVLRLRPEPGEDDEEVYTGGIVISPDGATMLVAGTQALDDDTGIVFLAEVLVGWPWSETRRVDLGPVSDDWRGRIKNFDVDWATGRAFVPVPTDGRIAVVDIATMTQIDTDGDSSNGTTPITLDATHTTPVSFLVSPDGTVGYSGMGAGTSMDVLVFDLATYALSDTLTSTTSGGANGPNLKISEDGRLFVPHVGYATPPMDGISVYDLSVDPATESIVTIAGGSSGNNDIWDIEFVPGTSLAYAVLADDSMIMPFDAGTFAPLDIDGDPINGQTNIEDTGCSSAYGGALVLTPF